jgi:hypothetical protein
MEGVVAAAAGALALAAAGAGAEEGALGGVEPGAGGFSPLARSTAILEPVARAFASALDALM